jgi:aldehyde:ferredoxin oxidoreductase
MKTIKGYNGVILDVDLSTGNIQKKEIPSNDLKLFIGGRGLGMKILWDSLKKPGVDPLSPKNPLLFMPGPFSGFPVPSASRTCVVTKSPITSPVKSRYGHASTISYSNMGGFFGPEIRFAGYDGIVVRGKASKPVYIMIADDKVEIRDATKYWGKKTDEFDKQFTEDLGDRRIRTCYIGPAGENLSPMACVINTAARAAGRGGTGCVMGSKKLKAIAVKGSGIPDVALHKQFLTLLGKAREDFKGTSSTASWRRYGTASALLSSSDSGTQAVKNFREGTFEFAHKIGGVAARKRIWHRDFACYVCPLACKKAGYSLLEPYQGMVHDGPEYETGTMLGSNLLISNLEGLMQLIYHADDLGIDIIGVGNVIGFLMECYEKKLIDTKFLNGIDLKWGNIEAAKQMITKISYRDGIGELAAQGVKTLAEKIKQDSHKFAIHCKGHGLAAWNCHVRPTQNLCYATSNRGACHLNGHSIGSQNNLALVDSTGLCLFARRGYQKTMVTDILEAICDRKWTAEDYLLAGERIFNLEKSFNYREGFRRKDDTAADRFFEEPLTYGPKKGAVQDRNTFTSIMNDYYKKRGWHQKSTKPMNSTLKRLKLDFVLRAI